MLFFEGCIFCLATFCNQCGMTFFGLVVLKRINISSKLEKRIIYMYVYYIKYIIGIHIIYIIHLFCILYTIYDKSIDIYIYFYLNCYMYLSFLLIFAFLFFRGSFDLLNFAINEECFFLIFLGRKEKLQRTNIRNHCTNKSPNKTKT